LYAKALAKAAGAYREFGNFRSATPAAPLSFEPELCRAVDRDLRKLPSSNPFYRTAVEELIAPAVYAARQGYSGLSPAEVGAKPAGIHPVPATHLYGPTPVGHCRERFLLLDPMLRVAACGAESRVGVHIEQEDTASGLPGEYVACLCADTDQGLQLVASTAWRPSEGGKPSPLGVWAGPEVACVVFVASTCHSEGRALPPVNLKVGSDKEVTVEVATAELRATIFTEGHDLAGQAYATIKNYAAPAPLLRCLPTAFEDSGPKPVPNAEEKQNMYDLRNDALKVHCLPSHLCSRVCTRAGGSWERRPRLCHPSPDSAALTV